MKFLNQEKGFSLVEVMIVMGLLVVTAAGYATYAKNVATHEAQMKARNALAEVDSRLTNAFKVKSMIVDNLGLHFRGRLLNSNPESLGFWFHVIRKEDPELDIAKTIFRPDQTFEGGRVKISDIIYKLADLRNDPADPSIRLATFTLTLEAWRCANGSPVCRTRQDEWNLCETQICPDESLIKTKKVYGNRNVTIKLNSSNFIEELP